MPARFSALHRGTENAYAGAMSLAPDHITLLGRTTHRRSHRVFGIRLADRRMHAIITGKTGTGKSHLLRLIAQQDMASGLAFAILEPNGDLARTLYDLVPHSRRSDLVYIDAANPDCVWRFNPFAGLAVSDHPLAAAGIVEVFKKLWLDDWGPRLEHLLRNVVYTLLETPEATFADIPVMLTDRSFRLRLALATCRTPSFKVSGTMNSRSTRRPSAPPSSRPFKTKSARSSPIQYFDASSLNAAR